MIDYYSRKDIERGLRYMFEFRIPVENLEAVLEELNKLKKLPSPRGGELK